jgi:hypothetical protein
MQAFQGLKEAKGNLTKQVLERCKYFTDIEVGPLHQTWETVTQYCQGSFINILESGYFLNNGTKNDKHLLVDFNKQSIYLYTTDKSGKPQETQQVRFEEILWFENMPTVSLEQVLNDMRERYSTYETTLNAIHQELDRIQIIIEKTKELGSDQNILMKTYHLKDTLLWDIKKTKLAYRFFYHRLDILELIEHDA